MSARQMEYYWQNKERILAQQREYVARPEIKARRREQMREWSRLYCQQRRLEPEYKLKQNLRRRLNHALSRLFKSGSAVRDLGCSIEMLKSWLMYQFQPGMTWENYGEWEIDHVKPLASFDLTDRGQLLEACNWYNLQPLWKAENRSKGSR